MYKKKKITVVMPCRNEGAHLAKVVRKIPKFVDETIVVSNRSTDNTVAVAKRLGVKVYEDDRVVKGVGYGFAHMTGIGAATGDIIVCMNADGTYPIEELSNIIDHLLEAKLDFISCNRYPLQPGTSIPLKLRLGVQLLNAEARLLCGYKFQDILSGMWIFKKTARKKLHLTMGDWNLSPQIKVNAARSVRFAEYSIVQHRRQGETKQSYLNTGLSHAWWLIKNRFTQAALTGYERYGYVVRFLFVGAAGFTLNSCILLLLSGAFDLNKVLSEIVGMFVSLQLTFILHDRWTYVEAHHNLTRYRLHISKRYGTYLASNSFGSIMTIVLFGFLSKTLPRLSALAIAALISMFWNFTLNKLVVWRKMTGQEG